MYRYSWLVDHSSTVLALASITILLFAWPMENVPGCVLAVVMMVVAAAIKMWAHFHPAGYAR
jgi:MFS superfamily sulfate permease-like transporter